MVRLFLVEDEIAMREGIRRFIPWEEVGIEFCGEAGDGELAWPMILEKKPDIVITDIRMPFMDGLQLSGLIRKEFPDTRIIILSGYGEFEYAQEALRMGVTEYLLKPVTPKKLREVITRVAASVAEEKRRDEERTDLLQEERREKEAHARRALFKTMISGGTASHTILEMADSLGLKLGAPYYRLLLLYMIPEEGRGDQAKTDEVLERLSESAEGRVVFEHSMDSIAVLLTGRSEEETEERTEQFLTAVKERVGREAFLHFFLSAGHLVSRLSEIHRSYHKAYRTASGRFFLPPDQVVTADMQFRTLLQENNPNPINTDRALQNGNVRSIWENFLRTGTAGEVEDFVEDVFSSVGEENVKSMLFLHYLTMDCYFSMVRFLKDMGRAPEEVDRSAGDINTVMSALSCAEDAGRYLTGYLREVIRLRDSHASKKNDLLLQNALAYIDEHYTDGTLSLQTVAAVSGFSPNRFSTMFSREMGMTFMEYLIGKRMERACELLMTTDMKAFEIAYQSGYNDPHYFSATFKKLRGMSPMEYRKRGQREQEG